MEEPTTSQPTKHNADVIPKRKAEEQTTADPDVAIVAITAMPTPDPSIPSSDGTCHLFRIPGEIRNRIYEYALTFDNGGLVCREDIVLQAVENAAKLYGDKGPTTPEQRDQQYVEYDRENRPKLYQNMGDTHEANQLKSVCRRLHHETKGLVLKYNDIIFLHADKDKSALVQCARFLHHCGDKWKPCIRTVTLKDAERHILSPLRRREITVPRPLVSRPRHAHDPVQIVADFCSRYPRSLIKHRLAGWHAHAENGRLVYLFGCIVRISYRGDLPVEWLGDRNFCVGMRKRSQQHGITSYLDFGQIPNYRIFPYDADFDEAQFREQMVANRRFSWMVHSYRAGGVDACVERVKGWFRNGI